MWQLLRHAKVEGSQLALGNRISLISRAIVVVNYYYVVSETLLMVSRHLLLNFHFLCLVLGFILKCRSKLSFTKLISIYSLLQGVILYGNFFSFAYSLFKVSLLDNYSALEAIFLLTTV